VSERAGPASEWNARAYHQQSTLQETLAAESLAALRLEGGERVLDVGCGDGKTTAAIAARVPRGSVLGLDPSRQMIAFAAEHFAPPDHPNLGFVVGDARTLCYDQEFDLVVSFYALHWVPEQGAALRGIRAALKPGGTTLLQFVRQGERSSIEDVIEATRQEPRWAGYFPTTFRKPYAHFTIEEYRALAEAAGLRVLRIDPKEIAWDFKSRDAFAAFCHATFVIWAQHLPPAELDPFITAVLDRYRAVAATGPADANTFKFYQMEVVLSPAG
jgi:trans-aconitate methyltransferase